MLDFFEWKIRHAPENFVESQNRWFLWDMVNGYQAVLVFEDWELRIYTYDWDSSDDEPEEEQRRWCWDIFERFTGYYDENSLGYVKVEACGSTEEIADEIYKSCEKQLISLYRISEDITEDFIKKHIDKIKKENKIYTYYK